MRTRMVLFAGGLALACSIPVTPVTPVSAAQSVKAAAGAYDFNGDGFRDLAIGSPGGRVGKAGKNAGFVSVVYGSKRGLDTGRWKVYSQDTSGVPGAAEAGDRFGNSVASADFDRDGYADLAIGAPGEDTGKAVDAGTVTVLWGSRGGLGRATARSEARGPGAHHRFGESLATGDIQHDGRPELFVTVPGTSTYTWLTFRTPTARTATLETTSLRATAQDVTDSWVASGDVNGDGRDDVVYGWFDWDGGVVEERRGFTLFLGTAAGGFTRGRTVYIAVKSLAVGDFNGDHRADVAVGVTDDRPYTGGSVTIYRGSPLGLGGSYSISQDTPGVPEKGIADDLFGLSLAVGDTNKDGRADLAVGAPKADVAKSPDAGRIFLVLGSPAGLTGRGTRAFTQNTKGVPGTSHPYDLFGYQVALLDHDHNGTADLTVGAPDENEGNGAVTYLRSTPTGLTTQGSQLIAPKTLGVQNRNAHLGGRLGRPN